jgi:AAA ATPase-like protein
VLHGGNDELAAVTALLQRTRAGNGGAVVVRGAEGAGKTTLLAEALWAARGLTVLQTAGPRGGGALPYTALRQLLATLHPRIGRLPHTRAQALRIALGLAPGAADRAVVAAAACALVTIAAREQPVVLLVDDAHWLDAASAAVVGYIAGRAEGLPIAVLRATRERVTQVGESRAAQPTIEAAAQPTTTRPTTEIDPNVEGRTGDTAHPAARTATVPGEAAHPAGTDADSGPAGTERVAPVGGRSTDEAIVETDAGAEGRVAASATRAAPADAGSAAPSPDLHSATATATTATATATGRATGTDVFWGARSDEQAVHSGRGSVVGEGADDARSAGVRPEPDAAGERLAATAAREARATRWVIGGGPSTAANGEVSISALPADARRLLALAALEPAADLEALLVAGRRVGVGRAARIAIQRAGMIEPAGRVIRFRNSAAREEVRRSLTAAERRTLHGALIHAATGALAYRRPWHLAALATGPDAELAAALEAGAGRTRRELGAGAAAATWEQAARLTADAGAARRRFVAAAYAAWEAGFPARARTLLDTADTGEVECVADDGASMATSGTAVRLRAALRHAEGHRSEAGALLLDAAHGRAALLLAATGAAWEAGDRERTMQARAALSALPLAADDPLRTVVAALGADGVSPAMVAPATRARLYGLGIALWEVTPLAVHAAATDEAAYDVLLDEAAVLRTHGARGALAAALMPLAVAGALSGRAVEAETHAAEGLRLARSTGQGTLAAWFLAALSMAATTQGRIAEARDGAWQALQLTGTKGLTPVGAYALYALAVVERVEGRTEAACELLATALSAPAGALMEVRIRAELATAGPNRTKIAALPPRATTHPLALALDSRITRAPQLAAGTSA